MTTKSNTRKYLEELRGGPLSFGAVLRSSRLCDEMTQEQYAKKIGISKQFLCDLEKGRRLVSVEQAAKFAKKLGYSVKQYIRYALQDQVRKAGFEKYAVHVDAA